MKRKRSFRRGRGPRSRVLWDRALSLQPLQPAGTPTAIVIGDPRILPGSAVGFDMRRTVRRIRLQFNVAIDLDVNVIAWGEMVCGVYVADRTAVVADPILAASSDNEVDWLDLWNVPMYTGLPTTVTSVYLPAPNSAQCLIRDIRVARQLDIDEVVVFVTQVTVLTGAIVIAQGSFQLAQSLLWTASPT